MLGGHKIPSRRRPSAKKMSGSAFGDAIKGSFKNIFLLMMAEGGERERKGTLKFPFYFSPPHSLPLLSLLLLTFLLLLPSSSFPPPPPLPLFPLHQTGHKELRHIGLKGVIWEREFRKQCLSCCYLVANSHQSAHMKLLLKSQSSFSPTRLRVKGNHVYALGTPHIQFSNPHV